MVQQKQRAIFSLAISALILGAVCVQAKIYDRKASDPYSSDPNRATEHKWNTRQYNQTQDVVQAAESSADQRTERLGGYSTGYGSSSVSGYPHSGSGVGYYSPLKYNLGGIILGTLVGVGALLIIPKIASAFHSGGPGGYYRSDDSSSDFTQLMHSISNFLDENRVDSAACVKRMICSSVRNSEYNLENQTADQIDQWISNLAENSFVKYMINGTQINEALDAGKRRNGKDCGIVYEECKLDKDKVLQLFGKLM